MKPEDLPEPKTEIILPTKGSTNANGRRYSVEDIERGLMAVALHGGCRPAERILESMGHPIPRDTLHDWTTRQHIVRFDEIRTEIQGRIAERIANEAETIILKASALEHQLMDGLSDQIGDLSANEKAGALRNVTTTKALNLDKIASPLRGRPSHITEHRSADEILRGLANRIPALAHALDDAATEAVDEATYGFSATKDGERIDPSTLHCLPESED